MREDSDERAAARRAKRMEEIDNLPKPIRELIHEEGYTIVHAFLNCGIKNPKHIKHLINAVRDGSYNGGVNPAARGRTGGPKI